MRVRRAYETIKSEVARNMKRFPEDFMFRLTKEEAKRRTRWTAISALCVHTEHGVAHAVECVEQRTSDRSEPLHHSHLHQTETNARNKRRTQTSVRSRHQKTLCARQILQGLVLFIGLTLK